METVSLINLYNLFQQRVAHLKEMIELRLMSPSKHPQFCAAFTEFEQQLLKAEETMNELLILVQRERAALPSVAHIVKAVEEQQEVIGRLQRSAADAWKVRLGEGDENVGVNNTVEVGVGGEHRMDEEKRQGRGICAADREKRKDGSDNARKRWELHSNPKVIRRAKKEPGN